MTMKPLPDGRPDYREDLLGASSWIAAEFSAIPFENHEARILAFGYFRLWSDREKLREALGRAQHWHEQLDYDEALNVIDAALAAVAPPETPRQ